MNGPRYYPSYVLTSLGAEATGGHTCATLAALVRAQRGDVRGLPSSLPAGETPLSWWRACPADLRDDAADDAAKMADLAFAVAEHQGGGQ